MKPKSESEKLQEKSPLFFSIGLFLALLFVISAFEWRTEITLSIPPIPEIGVSVLPPMPATYQPVPAKPKPRVTEPDKLVDPKDDIEKAITQIDVKPIITTSIVDVIDLPALPPEVVDETFQIVEKMPSFDGGTLAFLQYLGKNIKYPAKARNNNITGKVYVSFTVDKDGSLTNIKVVKGIGYGCDEEAMRVIRSAPNWNPGQQRGVPVKVSMTIPISFTLNN